MNAVDVIKIKRDGKPISKEVLREFFNDYLSGKIADYQMSAFLMAVYLNGLSKDETFYLTDIMLNSGKIINLNDIKLPKVDKHSIGGVGDKTSIILAPLVSSFDVVVPMVSGRGLGHTGGTLDKLQSIPNFRVDYSIKEYKRIIKKFGFIMNGQTDEIAPADKRIYALRDVTATVDNVSLITASIMSKKLAEGTDSIVFDIKIGNGSNLNNKTLCLKLTENLLNVSKRYGKKAVAVLTDMNEPLGYKIGNWLEIEECIELMSGKFIDDLLEVTSLLAGAMLYSAGKAKTIEEGKIMAQEKIFDGTALKRFYKMVKNQNGNVKYVKDWQNLKRPKHSLTIKSTSDGFVKEMNAFLIGLASVELGCGRKKKEDKIDNLAGIVLYKKSGDKIKKDDIICELFSSKKEKLFIAEEILSNAFVISKNKPIKRKLILDVIE